MRTLTEEQVGFLFAVGDAVLGEETAAELKVHSNAYHALDEAARKLPCWTRAMAGPDEFEINPYELCEQSFEFEDADVDGRVASACGPWFHTAGSFPRADVESLRDAAIQAYQNAAAQEGLSVQYVGARFYRCWRETESGLLEGI